MKTEETAPKKKTEIKQLRQIRDNIDEKIKNLTSKELVDFLQKQKTLHQPSVWK